MVVESRSRVGKSVALITVVLSMFWWNSGGNGRKGSVSVEGGSNGGGSSSRGIIGDGGGGFWGVAPPSNVGIAIAVTAMAGLTLAATLLYSHRGSLKSPWSRRRRKHALSTQQWKSLFTSDGRLRDRVKFLKKVHGGVKFLKKVRGGGVDPSIRAEVWPFLPGVSMMYLYLWRIIQEVVRSCYLLPGKMQPMILKILGTVILPGN